MERQHDDEVVRRLNVVIALLLRSLADEKSQLSLREQIRLLSDLKMRPRDIADVIGRDANYVNKELAGIRKVGGANVGKGNAR